MCSAVIPHELLTASAGGPCLDRDFSISISLSLSFPSCRASERGRQAGGQAGRQEAKSVYSNYLAETLPANPSNTPKASPFLPTSLWQRPAPYHVQPMKQQLLQICVSPLEEHRLSDGVKTALQYNNP